MRQSGSSAGCRPAAPAARPTQAAGPYADAVSQPRACLLDVYDTLLTCDFERMRTEVAAAAGVPAGTWADGISQISPALNDGRLSMTEGFGQILRASGLDPAPELLRTLTSMDRELLLATTLVFEDTIPFLELLRSRQVKVALVSNCAENTRDQLGRTGLAGLAGALVLSCEVGWAKPAAQIYRRALAALGVAPADAVFIDDQAAFCAGATALGLTAVQIARQEPAAAGPAAIRSLTEAEALF
jgi:putative hydrolase of the HAD superfamily